MPVTAATAVIRTATASQASQVMPATPTRTAPSAPAAQRDDGGDEFSRLDRLREMDVVTAAQRAGAVFGSRVGGQGGGRHVAQLGIAVPPDDGDQLEAIHPRHA